MAGIIRSPARWTGQIVAHWGGGFADGAGVPAFLRSREALKEEINTQLTSCPHATLAYLHRILFSLPVEPAQTHLTALRDALSALLEHKEAVPSITREQFEQIEQLRDALPGQLDAEALEELKKITSESLKHESGVFSLTSNFAREFLQKQFTTAPDSLKRCMELMRPFAEFRNKPEDLTALETWGQRLTKEQIASEWYQKTEEALTEPEKREILQFLRLIQESGGSDTTDGTVRGTFLTAFHALERLVAAQEGLMPLFKEQFMKQVVALFGDSSKPLVALVHKLRLLQTGKAQHSDIFELNELLTLAGQEPAGFGLPHDWKNAHEQVVREIQQSQDTKAAAALAEHMDREYLSKQRGPIPQLVNQVADDLFKSLSDRLVDALTATPDKELISLRDHLAAVLGEEEDQTERLTALHDLLVAYEPRLHDLFAPRSATYAEYLVNLYQRIIAATAPNPEQENGRIQRSLHHQLHELHAAVREVITKKSGMLARLTEGVKGTLSGAITGGAGPRIGPPAAARRLEFGAGEAAPRAATTVGYLDWITSHLGKLPQLVGVQFIRFAAEAVQYIFDRAINALDHEQDDRSGDIQALRDAKGQLATFCSQEVTLQAFIALMKQIRMRLAHSRFFLNNVIQLPSLSSPPPIQDRTVDTLTRRLRDMGMSEQTAPENASNWKEKLNEEKTIALRNTKLFLLHRSVNLVLGPPPEGSRGKFHLLMRNIQGLSNGEHREAFMRHLDTYISSREDVNFILQPLVRWFVPIVSHVIDFFVDHFGEGLFQFILSSIQEVRDEEIKPFNAHPIRHTAQFFSTYTELQEDFGRADERGELKDAFVRKHFLDAKNKRGHDRIDLYQKFTHSILTHSLPSLGITSHLDALKVKVEELFRSTVRATDSDYFTYLLYVPFTLIKGFIWVARLLAQGVEKLLSSLMVWSLSATLNWFNFFERFLEGRSNSLVDRSEFNHALDQLVMEQLQMICEIMVKEPTSDELPKLKNTEEVRGHLKELIKNLHQALEVNAITTKQEMHRHNLRVANQPAEMRFADAIKAHTLPQLIDTLVYLLLVAYRSLLQEQQLEKLTYQLVAKVNSAYANADRDLEHHELLQRKRDSDATLERIRSLTDQVLWMSIDAGLKSIGDDFGKSKKEAVINYCQTIRSIFLGDAESGNGFLYTLNQMLQEFETQDTQQRTRLLREMHKEYGIAIQKWRDQYIKISSDHQVGIAQDTEFEELTHAVKKAEEDLSTAFTALHDMHVWKTVYDEEVFTQIPALIDNGLGAYRAVFEQIHERGADVSMESFEAVNQALHQFEAAAAQIKELPTELKLLNALTNQLGDHILTFKNKIVSLKNYLLFLQQKREIIDLGGDLDRLCDAKNAAFNRGFWSIPQAGQEETPGSILMRVKEKLQQAFGKEPNPDDARRFGQQLTLLEDNFEQLKNATTEASVAQFKHAIQQQFQEIARGKQIFVADFQRALKKSSETLQTTGRQVLTKMDEARAVSDAAEGAVDQSFSGSTQLTEATQSLREASEKFRLTVETLTPPTYHNLKLLPTGPITGLLQRAAFGGAKDIVTKLIDMVRTDPTVYKGLMEYNVVIPMVESS